MTSTDETISKVRSLLEEGLNEKLRHSGKAKEPLQAAYDLTKTQDLSKSIWPYIAAYRLAHCLFRTAENESELKTVLDLFDEAAKDRLLKPKAKFYALAVKCRMGKPSQSEFEQITDLISGVSRRSASKLRHNQQDIVVNQLELLAYLGNFEYAPLYGLNLFDGIGIGDATNNWKILGGTTLYPKPYAESEVKRLHSESTGLHSAFCIWDSKQNKYICESKSGSIKINKAQAELLTTVLCGEFDLLHVLNKHSRKKTRLNDDFNRLFEIDLLEEGNYKINPLIKVYVAASTKAIDCHIKEINGTEK